MGFGFRKSFKIAPGVRLNVSSKSLLEEPLQTDKPKALKRQKKTLKSELVSKWLPVIVLNFIVVYSSNPLA